MIPRQYTRTPKLTIRWCTETGHWVLRRGPARIASSVDWWELYAVCLRIANRERAAARREAFLHG